MAHPATEIAVDELSVEERLPLLGRLWDSLLDSGPPPVPAWHQDIIRQRIAAAGANPGASIPLRRTPRGFAAEAGMKVPVSVSPAITDDIRVLVGDSGALSKANALCALVPHAKDDAVLLTGR